MAARPTTNRAVAAGWLAALLVLAGCSGASMPAGGRAGSGSSPSAQAARPSPQPSKQPPTGPYVAIGDSYTAGLQVQPPGGGPQGCGRSSANYPSLVAKGLGLAAADFTDVSCSSATTADLTAAQQVAGGPNPAQLDALNERTRLVTLGIGGNDADFTKVVSRCAEQGLAQSLVSALDPSRASGAPCQAYYTGADGKDQLAGLLDTVGVRLAGVLREVARRAPQARVYVVGYPALLPADPAGCLPVLGRTVATGDLAFLAVQEQRLDAILQAKAAAAGAGYVDTYAPSAGHDMCAAETDRWVEPPFPASGRAPLHPNSAGQQGMAEAVLRTVRAG